MRKPLYGVDSINIIIPRGIKHLGGELGHIELYSMDGFRTNAYDIRVYRNIKYW